MGEEVPGIWRLMRAPIGPPLEAQCLRLPGWAGPSGGRDLPGWAGTTEGGGTFRGGRGLPGVGGDYGGGGVISVRPSLHVPESGPWKQPFNTCAAGRSENMRVLMLKAAPEGSNLERVMC